MKRMASYEEFKGSYKMSREDLQDMQALHGIDAASEIDKLVRDTGCIGKVETRLEIKNGKPGTTFEFIDRNGVKVWSQHENEPVQYHVPLDESGGYTGVSGHRMMPLGVSGHSGTSGVSGWSSYTPGFSGHSDGRYPTNSWEKHREMPSREPVEEKVTRKIDEMYEKMNILNWKNLIIGAIVSLIIGIIVNHLK